MTRSATLRCLLAFLVALTAPLGSGALVAAQASQAKQQAATAKQDTPARQDAAAKQQQDPAAKQQEDAAPKQQQAARAKREPSTASATPAQSWRQRLRDNSDALMWGLALAALII